MTKKTIEVPVELIERGDIAGLRKLLPQDYFGRWATYSEVRKVLVVESCPNEDGEIKCILHPKHERKPLTYSLPFNELDFDSTELVTMEDFENAPNGTIITHKDYLCHQKCGVHWWAGDVKMPRYELEKMGPWQVLRWGDDDE